MHIKIFLKKFISIGVAAILAVTLVGCFDLGDFSDEEAYYAAFGDVRLVYQNPEVEAKDVEYKDYGVRDYFYNKNTGEDFSYGDPEDDESDEGKNIAQLPYAYMALPLNQNMNIDSFALYLNATKSGSLEIIFYLVDELPNGGNFTGIRLLGDPEYQQKLDGDGNPMFDAQGNPVYQEKLDESNTPVYDEDGNLVYETVDYSDPDDSFKVATVTAYARQDEWVSFTVDYWKGENVVAVKKSQYLLLRFVNNGGIYKGEDSSIAFRVTNLLVRAFS